MSTKGVHLEHAEIERLVMKPTERRRLGKYVLLGRIGQGGMGKIYLAFAPGPAGIEKLLVVKRLHGHLTGDALLVHAFLDEARLSMALNHPNIVTTFDVGEVDGRFFMVMEYIDGQNLGVVLRTAKRSGQYPSSLLWAGVFLGVLDGLHAAHIARDTRGRPLQIIHRDVSPQNILVTYDGLPKLVDFGIAKAAMRVSETDAGVLKGKYAYMSPEQVRGEPLDARSDVFAAGIVLWEMLAGRRLYKADTIVRSVERILTEPTVSPVRVNADCDPQIAKIAYKALHKNREQRFASALDFKEALDEVIRQSATRTRQTDVRDLMQRMFGDVIDKQRAVLQACLSAEGHPQPLIGADEEDVRSAVPRTRGSESGLSLAVLADANDGLRRPGEVTTPSHIGPSPFIMRESEPQPDVAPLAHTSIDRKTRKPPGQSAGLMLEDAVAARSHRRVPVRLMAAGLFALLALAIVLKLASGTKDAGTGAVPLATTVSGRSATGEATSSSDGGARDTNVRDGKGRAGDVRAGDVSDTNGRAPDVRAADVNAADVGTADEGDGKVRAADGSDADARSADVIAADERDGKVRAADERDGKVRAADGRKLSDAKGSNASGAVKAGGKRVRDGRDGRKGKSTAAAKVQSATARDEGATAVVEEMRAEGTLTLDTVPWTTVYLGKRRLGETPLNKVVVPAGTLELVLENAEKNIKETYLANVKAGAEYRARLDLN